MSEAESRQSVKLPQESATKTLTVVGLLGGFGAFFAASCCVLPLAFASVGLGGAWLASLDSLLAYRQELQIAALVALGLGWAAYLWRELRAKASCVPSEFRWRTPVMLGVGTLLVIGSWAIWETQGSIRNWIFEMREFL